MSNRSNPSATSRNPEVQVMSPCISQCCLDEADVCVGCFRHVDEITGWHSADNQRRQSILDNCQKRKQAKTTPDYQG